MRELLQKKHCRLFLRNPPQSPTVEVKDEINFLSRTKTLPDEIHVNRLVAFVGLAANTSDIPAAPTFQLRSETSPPVEIRDAINLSGASRKFLSEEVKLDQLLICSLIVPLHCSSGSAYISAGSSHLQPPQSPCVEIKDEVNVRNGRNQKSLYEFQIEDIFIDYPEITSSHPVDRITFLDENILQEPPVELSDRINTEVRLRRTSLSKNEVFEIRCFMPVFINHYENLRNLIMKDSPQKPDIDISDNCNKLAIKVKQLQDEANDDVIVIVPVVSEDSPDGIKTHRIFSICEPQPMELILEDEINRTTNVRKIICDFSIGYNSIINIPAGFSQSKVSTKLEFEPFDTMVIPTDIEDHFQKTIFNFNRTFAEDQEGINLSIPSCPICSSVVKIDQFLEAPPQSPPPETEDRLNVLSRLRKIFNDSIVINIQTESLPSLSSEYSLLGSEILAWSRPTCPQDVSSDDEKYICHKPLEMTNVDHGGGLLLSPLLSPKDNPVTSRPQSLGIQIFSIQ